MNTPGVFSMPGDIMSTVGDTISAPGGVQYTGGIMNTPGGVQYIGGYHEYTGGYQDARGVLS